MSWLLVTYAVAAVGGMASGADAATFYEQLTRPSWAPPAWLFAPVWGLLYGLMGIAAWLVWSRTGWRRSQAALGLYLLQLLLNGLWTWLFFAWRLGALAFAEIVVLWVAILATLVMFWRVRRLAGALLMPYLLWVTYAAALNYALWQRNPESLA